MLLDDFIAEGSSSTYDWAGEFKRGWHLPQLAHASRAIELARHHAFQLKANQDLTPHLRLRAWPDAVAANILNIARRFSTRLPMVSSLLGSLAQQNGFKHGQLCYRFLVFERGH